MIRQRIVSLYLEHGSPVSLVNISKELGISDAELQQQLYSTEKLSDLNDLEVKQANELIQFYGKEVLFEKSVVENVMQLLSVREKLDTIEKKVQKNRDDPSDT